MSGLQAANHDPYAFEMIDDGGWMKPPPKSASPPPKPAKKAAPKQSGKKYRLTSDEKKAVRAGAKRAGGWILEVNVRGNHSADSINVLLLGGMNKSESDRNRWTLTEMDTRGIPLTADGKAIVDIFVYSGTREDRELESNIILHVDTAKGGLVKITGDSEDGATYWKKP